MVRTLNYPVAIGALLVCMLFTGCDESSQNWKLTFQQELPVLGHRNWIVIADSAYPKQSAPGIRTIHTDAEQLEVIKTVLAEIERAPHVQGISHVDLEMDHIGEEDAPGIGAYREALKEILSDRSIAMPHEDIIKQLDADSRLYNVLILKTDMTIPYTSVFIKLDCGYWDAQKEENLRNRLQNID